MKRLSMVLVAGVAWFAPSWAQDVAPAPTAPVVPAPMYQSSKPNLPMGGTALVGSRVPARKTWSPIRNPVVASEPIASTPAPLPTTSESTPPQPQSAAAVESNCGPNGCRRARSSINWDRIKAWMCYRPTKTDLPKLQPMPYHTPLQGMFACTSAAGCACAHAQPVMVPVMPAPQSPPSPQTIPKSANAGAKKILPHIQMTALQPTWQGRNNTIIADRPVAVSETKPIQGAAVTAEDRPMQK